MEPMEIEQEVYWRPVEVADRLGYLGLTPDDLWESVSFGLGYAAECTANDPPAGRGYIAWVKINRMLRDLLIPKGWSKDNAQNYATTVHESGDWAIAVASGDSRTGRRNETPATRTEKGPVTQQVIGANQLSFGNIPGADTQWQRSGSATTRRTWLLLHYFDEDADETRAELSLPAAMTQDGFVVEWQTRIILPIPLDDPSIGWSSGIDDGPEDTGDIDIPVEMRA